MPTYTYNNGNFSSTTNIVNGLAYTQNVMMLGATGNGCGDQPCPQGYSLYFPCLKNITRGEDACFEFYVVNNAIKDVVDLRTVEALSISLSGNFGCSLGTYTYPSDEDYIKSLQSQTYKALLDEDFSERQKYRLNVISVDTDIEIISESNIEGNTGKYFEGDIAILEAFDTESYIFVGWVDTDTDLDDECDDFFFSTERRVSIVMDRNKNIAAVYRKRKLYKVSTVETNSFFSYYKDGDELPLENGHYFREGEYVVVRTIPVSSVFSKWDVSGLNGSYHTSENNVVMQICMESDITLKIETMDTSESDFDSDYDMGVFDLNFIGFSFKSLISLCNINLKRGEIEKHQMGMNELSDSLIYSGDIDIQSIFSSCKPIEYKNLYCYNMGNNTLLKFGDKQENGYVVLPNPGLKNETVVEIYCRKHDECDNCSISVDLDDKESQVQELYDTENILVFRFDRTDFDTIKISTIGEIFPEEKSGVCFVDRIVVSDTTTVDKGKAALCLPGSVTSKFHRGKIVATGAVIINGKSYGLPCTQIGNVTNNPVINTIVL